MNTLKTLLTGFLLFFILFTCSNIYSKEAKDNKTIIKKEEKQRGFDFSNLAIDFGLSNDAVALFSKENDSLFINNTKLNFDVLFSKDVKFTAVGRNLYINIFNPEIDDRVVPVEQQANLNDIVPAETTKSKDIIDLETALFSLKLKDVHLKAGRFIHKLGQGLTLYGPGDGLDFTMLFSSFDIQVVGAYTGLLLPDLDVYKFDNYSFYKSTILNDSLDSEEVSDFESGSNRVFMGIKPTYYFKNHDVYLLFLYNMDLRKKDYEKYTSMYAGFGVEGNLTSNLSYNVEGIYEMGDSPAPIIEFETDDKIGANQTSKTYKTVGDTSTVGAWAGLIRLNYVINAPIKPLVFLQGVVASGDSDRYKTMSSEGNESGDDNMYKGFNPYLTLGFSARPETSNIQAYTLGTIMAPITGSKLFEKFYVSLRLNGYMKMKKDGNAAGYYGISGDMENSATNDKSYLGSSVDLLLNWKIVSDVAFVGGIGLFFPGDAFTNTDMVGMYQAGLSITFL